MSPKTLEGQTLGKYRVMEALGRGGMAQVYKAYHPQLDRYAAIKVLRSDLVEETEFLARFQREARASANLRHPNIVQVFDFDSQDDIYYMVMELLEGDTLRARLNEYRVKNQRMPLPEIARVLKDTLNGLAYAHIAGLIHRDIKPANIMLTKRGDAVLTDFGIAQIVSGTQYTASGALMGTLNYMAPEQGLQGHCDRRSDLYSLGIVFYEMLTGYTPFDADTPLAILMKHLNDPLPLPHWLDPDLPEALERVVLKALAKNPDDRYQTAEEMSAALEQAANDLPEGARKLVPPPDGMTHSVYSGTSRRQIVDRGFAEADTDADILNPTPRGRIDQSAPETNPVTRLIDAIAFPIHPAIAVLIGLSVFLLSNIFAAMTLSYTGLSVWERGWAFEVFLAAAFFAMLGWSVQIPWLLIPGLIIFGNAMLLAYSGLTGRWDDWIFLWMFEPLIVAGAIILPIWMDKRLKNVSAWSRATGAGLFVLALVLATLTCRLALPGS
jgi:serine/threonine protein kinase